MKTNFASFILLPLLTVSMLCQMMNYQYLSIFFLLLLFDGCGGLYRTIKMDIKKNKVVLKFKTIYQKWIPFGKYHTIMLFGSIITKLDITDEKTLKHELVHKYQGYEIGWFLFYYLYLIEWIIQFSISYFINNKFQFKLSIGYGYDHISLEQEANLSDVVYDYAMKRDNYSWMKILFKGHNIHNIPNF